MGSELKIMKRNPDAGQDGVTEIILHNMRAISLSSCEFVIFSDANRLLSQLLKYT
jgi:hypothetical protein